MRGAGLPLMLPHSLHIQSRTQGAVRHPEARLCRCWPPQLYHADSQAQGEGHLHKPIRDVAAVPS